MSALLQRGRYRARLAHCSADLEAAQRLRFRMFVSDMSADDATSEKDADTFDSICHHVLIEDISTGRLVATFRYLPLASGQDIESSYAAQFYELAGLSNFDAPMIELGRFCIAPDVTDPDILRIAWGALAQAVDASGVEMLFGCSSFRGVDATLYHDAFAMLRERHLAPSRWLPRVKAPNVFRFARRLRPDIARALRTMPPLLRSYLTMGGWVSDHAVIDTHLNTLHVFTGLEIKAIPPRRRAALLGLAS